MRSLLPELRANLKLAAPIILTQFTFMGMGTVDTLFAGRLGADSLAAIGIGVNVWFLFFVVFLGLFMACSPIVAQRVGAQDAALETGSFVRASAGVAVIGGAIWMLATWLLRDILLDALEVQGQARTYARDYLFALSWGAIPLCLCFVARNVADGHGLTRVGLMAGLGGFAVNAGFDYLLMFGRWGLPELGPAGCGWASTLAALAMLAVYAGLYSRLPRLRALQLWRSGWPHAGVGELLRLGLPIAFIFAAEAWLFSVGALLMARFGTTAMAAHQIAINIASLAFMVPMSIGFATTVRVGQAAGAGLHARLRERGLAGIALGAGFAGLSALLMATVPEVIVGWFTLDAAVAALAVRFLYFAAVFQLFDCVQATANGALRGLKDTRVPMLVTLTAYWLVGFPLAFWLAFSTEVRQFAVWWGFIVALGVAAVGLGLRFWIKSGRVPRRSSPAVAVDVKA